MPNGLRGTFNLAMNVNDEEFVGKAQEIINEKASRLLDLAYTKTVEKEKSLYERIDELNEQVT